MKKVIILKNRKKGESILPENIHILLSEKSGGDTSSTFIFEQLTTATTMNINHELNKFPSVSLVDIGGNLVQGDVVYIDENNLQVNTSADFIGRVYLN